MNGVRVDITTFSTVSIKPAAVYIAEADVVVVSSSLVDDCVNLNSFSPVGKLSAELLGIKNVPDTAPFASVVNVVAPAGCAVTVLTPTKGV